MTEGRAMNLRLATRESGNVVLLRVLAQVRSLMTENLGRRLLRRCRRMMDAVGLCQAELSLLFTDDDVIADANQGWLKRRGPTDVISFPTGEGRSDLRPWLHPVRPTERSPERMLGDIMISLRTAKGRSPGAAAYEKDLTALLVHGFGHLLHYDHHGTATVQKEWKDVQEALLEVATARGAVRRARAL